MTGYPKFSSADRDESSVISTYMGQANQFPILSAEEERHYTSRFFQRREELGDVLSAFPRVILPEIEKARITQIQEGDVGNNDVESTVDEKRCRVISLMSSLETVADLLADSAADESVEGGQLRKGMHASLKKLMDGFLFQYDFYAASVGLIQECLADCTDDVRERMQADLLLMPLADAERLLAQMTPLFDDMETARNSLLEANLRMIIKLSKRYMKYGLSFQDLFQEGYFGMAIALDKFQPARGHRFSTYAVWWIRQSVTNALSSQARTIRLPANLARLLTRIHRMEQTLLQELGREPTDEEIADRLDQLPERIRAWRKIEQQPISLESSIGHDSDSGSIHDLVADVGSRQPDEIVSSKMLKDAVAAVLDTLSDREREILVHRFGIQGSSLMTLEELSRRFHVSHERIRQIEAAALKKLRSPDRRKYFDGYY